MRRKRRLPTDLEILDGIYDRYYDEFKRGAEDAAPDEGKNEEELRESKLFVPIDISAIAKELHVDGDIVFGRLYYYLDHRYSYEREDGCVVPLFAREAGREKDCVNFPYMASVLAGLREDAKRHRQNMMVAVVAVIVSCVAIISSAWVTIVASAR